ncbi:retrovirus-related pol polyprotein from transposon TNT 1-94, partial [Tanacetum coccineum]
SKKAFPVGKSRRADDVLELIHADLCGPIRVESLAGIERPPNSFWAEGVATAVYLLNISPMKVVWNETPYEASCGNKPSVSHLRVFGCICYALRTTKKHKLEDKSQKFIFVGYCTQSKAYRLYDPTHEKIVVSRNVVFDESSSWRWDNDTEISNSQLKMEEEEVLVENAANDTPSTSQAESLNSTPNRSNSRSDSDSSLEEFMQNNRKFRSIDDIYAASPLILFAGDPLSVEEAIKKEEWRRAMEDELQAINKNMTWELVSLPQGKTAIGLKWIFKTKFLTDGSIQKHKAILVVKGYDKTLINDLHRFLYKLPGSYLIKQHHEQHHHTRSKAGNKRRWD